MIGRSDGWAVPPPMGSSRRVLGRSGSNAAGPNAPGSGLPGRSAARRRRRPRVRTVLLVVVVLVVAVPVAMVAFGWWQYSRIPTIDLASVLSGRGGRDGTNYLIVGTDSRAGISVDDPNAGAFLAEDVSGTRTDTILVLHLQGSTSTITSVPRDLWVTDPATGQKGRINSTFAAGPANLVRAVEQLGIPVDHYLQIDFVAFSKMVDALGGITIDFPHPAHDDHSGLYVDTAGPVHLDGSQALAYVRSRYYTELVDGRWRTDGTADLGRTLRQRAFLTSLLHEAGSTRDPLVLLRLPGALRSGLVHDTSLGFVAAMRFAWTMQDAHPEAVAIPVTPRRTTGGADVLELGPGSQSVIAALAT